MNDIFIHDPAPAEYDFISECVGKSSVSRVIAECSTFGNLLYKTNQHINLTAIPPEHFWTKHICDSLLVLREAPGIFQGKVADIGCGAGLPAIPIAIACPELDITAIDSRGKKIDFVQQAAIMCHANHLKAVHARANELAAQDCYRNAFNLITARAVSDAFTLMKECRKLIEQNGTLCIFRTEQQISDELPNLKKSKSHFACTPSVHLPDNAGERLFLLITRF